MAWGQEGLLLLSLKPLLYGKEDLEKKGALFLPGTLSTCCMPLPSWALLDLGLGAAVAVECQPLWLGLC